MTTMLDFNKVETRDDFIAFAHNFANAYTTKSHDWEWDNDRLDIFLDALAAWTNDMSKHRQIYEEPMTPSWRLFAEILMAATMYE